jgi:heat shock protein HslJ
VFAAGGRVSGADGCNRLTGSYTAKGEALTFGQIASTQMACPDTEEVARRFQGALKGTSRWRLADGRLEFYGATGKPLAVFERRAAAPDRDASPLQGTSWQLVRFQGGDDTVLTPDDGAKYTLQFGAGGRIAARLDCNRGNGTWQATGAGQLTLGPLALTRAMCPPGSLHDHLVRQWAAIRSYVIEDGHLFLSLMADGGIYEFAPMTASRP